MRYDRKYIGKWVAVKGERVVLSDKTLEKLMEKVNKGKYKDKVYYASIPKYYIAGYNVAV